MTAQQISSTGSKKGKVSAYDVAVAANAKVVALQKTQATVANLQAANKSLSQQLYQGTLTTPSISSQLATTNSTIPYVQAIVASGKWGPNAVTNAQVARSANTTYESTAPGATVSTGNITKFITYVGSLTSTQTTLTTKKTTITNKISTNNAKITALTSKNGSGKVVSKSSKANTTPQPQKATPPPEFPTSDYLWNLPPHAWSLPVEPDSIVSDVVPHKEGDFHTNRRGRIWYYNGYVGPVNVLDYEGTGTYKQDSNGKALPGTTSINKYGFQFVWNPETFSQNTQVNMSVTPSNTDPTVGLTGFAAANSTMTFTIRLDRTNDFACAKSFKNNDLSTTITLPNTNSQKGYNPVQELNQAANSSKFLTKYYTVGNPVTADTNLDEKIAELMTYGTEADIEYLYKTVNGSGWKGIGGRDTSNIGYLMPALIRIDLGNQKFVGVVSSIGVNHLAFTRDLVPIRTDVSITVDLRANIQPLTNAGGVGK